MTVAMNDNLTVIRNENLNIKSRYFFAPINAGLSDANGNPRKELISFHAKRSGPEIGINYIGNVSIHKDYVTNDNTLYVSDNMEHWTDLTKTISDAGSLPGVQVACYKSDYTLIRKWKNNDNQAYIDFTQKEINALTTEDIEELIGQFIDSSVTLIELGFKVIQIHAGHGYFLSTFISPIFNKREDEYGQDTLLILKRIFRGIREKAGYDDYLLDLRISYFEQSIEENLEIKHAMLEELCEIGDLDMISQTNGMYNLSKRLMYPHRTFGHCFMLDPIAKLSKKYPNVIWNLCGNIWDLNEIEEADIPTNLSFSIGRALLADDDFVAKGLQLKKGKINPCTFCNKCHYYSMGLPNITCGVNDDIF